MKRLIWFYFVAALGTAQGADRWWVISFDGEPSGYEHVSAEGLDGGNIRTTDEMIIVLNRLGSKVEVRTKTESNESGEGALISVREETSSSEQTLVTEAEVQADQFVLHSKSGSNDYTRSIPRRGPVCGPEAFTRMTRDTLKKPGDVVTCTLFEPSSGPFRSTLRLVGEEEVDGQRVLRVAMTIGDAKEGPVLLLDREGNIFQTERDMPFGKMVVRASDRERALQAAARGGNLPAESYDRTMARSNVRFADARAIDRIRLRITHKKPEAGWPALLGPSQTIIEKTPEHVVLEIASPEPKPMPNDVDEKRYLKPNQILQSDDPEVLRLAQEIAGSEPDRFKAARKLQDWVAGNLTFDLGIALAPASEVVHNRRGTCVAYAVLLASMARAVGIPSRVAMGYIYLGGIWGGHAWVETLVDGQWLPFDAAGYRPGVADAARFQFDSYTLEDNLAAGNVAGLQLYGNIDVEVLEYTIGGKIIQAGGEASPYSIHENEYRSLSLGVSIRKPGDFTFGKLDAVYPDPTVLEVKAGASKATVSLLEVVRDNDSRLSKAAAAMPDLKPVPAKLDGRDAVVVSASGRVQLISRQGESLWLITAEGPDAGSLMDRIAGGWKWISPE